jgi:hypothetical protein
MKKILLFILLATASAQAWPFNKKPKYVGVGPTLQEQQSIEANQKLEKAKADQMQRIKEMRNKILAREPYSADVLYSKEKDALANFHYSLNQYEQYLADSIKAGESADKRKEIEREILESKKSSDLECPRKQIKELQDALAKKENEDSWHDKSFQSEKSAVTFLNQLANEAQAKWDSEVNAQKARLQKTAQADADYEDRKKLSNEERLAIYKTNGAAEQNDYLRSLTPERRVLQERIIADIANKLKSVGYEVQEKNNAELRASVAAIAASQRAKEDSHSLSRMASAMEQQATAAEQSVFNSRFNSLTAPSLPSDSSSSSKVEYSRTILPSGQTISTTTWK